MMEWFRRLFGGKTYAGRHRTPGIHRAPMLTWQLKRDRIRALRRRPTAARPPLRVLIATQRVPARSRFVSAARPAQQRAAAAMTTAVAVGSHLARRVGAHRHDGQTTAEHHDLVTKIMKRQARDERRLAKQRARGEQSIFARRPRGEFAWQ